LAIAKRGLDANACLLLQATPHGLGRCQPWWALLGNFLEGPFFDRAGNLYVTDIPHGRIFRIDAVGRWTLVAEYDGWPNGTAFHRDGSL